MKACWLQAAAGFFFPPNLICIFSSLPLRWLEWGVETAILLTGREYTDSPELNPKTAVCLAKAEVP
jgi:hypothetical protein